MTLTWIASILKKLFLNIILHVRFHITKMIRMISFFLKWKRYIIPVYFNILLCISVLWHWNGFIYLMYKTLRRGHTILNLRLTLTKIKCLCIKILTLSLLVDSWHYFKCLNCNSKNLYERERDRDFRSITVVFIWHRQIWTICEWITLCITLIIMQWQLYVNL